MQKITNQQETIIISAILFLIVFFGGFMRLYQLGYSSYWIDEGFTLMQVRGIVQYGYPLLDSGFMEWKDVLIPYITAPFVKFFGFEYKWLLRLPSAIFGILTIFVGYHLAVNMFSRYTGLMFAFFIASCHWYIAWSQQVRGYSAVMFFVLLLFYFLSRYERTTMMRYVTYAFISIICAVLAKKFAIILFVPFLVYIFSKKLYKLFLIFIIPSIIVSVFFVHIARDSLVINSLNYFYFYISEYLFSYFGIFFILSLIGFICANLFVKKPNSLHASIALFVVISILVFSLFIFVSERRYLLMVTPFLFLYTAYFIECVARRFKYKLIVGILIFVGVISISIIYKNSTILVAKKHYVLEYYTPQPNYDKAYEEIIERGFSNEDIIISANPYMDIIYLGRANYAIPWSLTGRGDDTTMGLEREFHSGARKIYGKGRVTGLDKIISLQKKGNVYVVLDSLSSRRMKFDLWDDITDIGDKIFTDGDTHSVTVYVFPKINL